MDPKHQITTTVALDSVDFLHFLTVVPAFPYCSTCRKTHTYRACRRAFNIWFCLEVWSGNKQHASFIYDETATGFLFALCNDYGALPACPPWFGYACTLSIMPIKLSTTSLRSPIRPSRSRCIHALPVMETRICSWWYVVYQRSSCVCHIGLREGALNVGKDDSGGTDLNPHLVHSVEVLCIEILLAPLLALLGRQLRART